MSRRIAVSIIIIITVITGFATYLASGLKFDYDFESFFPKEDTDLDYFLKYRATFKNDNDYMLIAIGNKEGIFSDNFLEKADRFTADLEKLPHVVSVISPTNIKQPVFSAFGFMEIPLLHVGEPEKYKNDSIRIAKSKEYINTLFAPDFKSISIVVNNVDIINKKESDALIFALEELIQEYDFEIIHYAGKIRGQKAYLTIMNKEVKLFLLASVLLVIIFLIISFRSFFGTVIPIITVFIAIIWTLAFMFLLGKKLDLMTMLLPTILFVVGMSDAVHILNRFIEELRKNKSKKEAVRITFKEVGLATLLTSITTAVGFFTLIVVSVVPVKEFGIYSGIGVIFAFLIAITLLPAILTLSRPPAIIKHRKKEMFWNRFLSKTLLITLRHPKRIVVIYTLILATSVIGIFQLKVDFHLLEDLHESHPLQQDFRFFENTYSGVRPFEMAILLKDTHQVFDYEVIKELDKVEKYLYDDYGVNFLLSPVAVVKMINKAQNTGNSNAYKIPETKKDYQKITKWLKNPSIKKHLSNLVSPDKKTIRFTGKMHDVGSYQSRILNDDFDTFFNQNINPQYFDYNMTGTALLVDKNNSIMASNMIIGLSIAFLLIASLMGILFKSFKMALISLIPNAIPLIIIAGIMGFTGTSINMSTSIIFTIAFGIAVDDTIHFLSKYKLQRGIGLTNLYAIKRTFLSTGKAIVLTSVILCSGFLSLMLSDFKSTYLIGVYITLILIFAVITDLLLLPILLLKRK
ncbi:MAG TPA: efflux RND transporter permease subunit [Vicingaceae bacterium]